MFWLRGNSVLQLDVCGTIVQRTVALLKIAPMNRNEKDHFKLTVCLIPMTTVLVRNESCKLSTGKV